MAVQDQVPNAYVPLAMTEPPPVEQRFRQLVHQWKEATRFESSIHDMISHRAYLQIIGMGKQALPLLVQELRRDPDHRPPTSPWLATTPISCAGLERKLRFRPEAGTFPSRALGKWRSSARHRGSARGCPVRRTRHMPPRARNQAHCVVPVARVLKVAPGRTVPLPHVLPQQLQPNHGCCGFLRSRRRNAPR
jgi:hypothetical protein